MGSRHDATRMNVEGDRLSSLPDDLIHKILSSISLKQAIETSTLSSRWRYIWTSMPYLDFSTQSFSKWKKFSKFVTKVLSRRNNQVQLSSVKLRVRGKATQMLVKRILNYAFSHKVEQLTFVSSSAPKDDIAFPINLLSSQSLKHLTLTLSHESSCTSTWDLPALTTLCLTRIKFNDDFFSTCPNLKNLTLYSCDTTIGLSEESEESHVNIRLSKLSNLTLDHVSCDVVNVDAPQLKNLIIRETYHDYSVNFSADAVLSLEKVDLAICYAHKAETIFCLLQQFRNVKFLTLNLEIVECLSSSVELISHQPSPFANLKSLKIYPVVTSYANSNVSNLVENYFLDSSPGATLTMVLREEIRSHKLMKELQKLLKCWKANSDQNTAHVDQEEVENQRAQQETITDSYFGERLTKIKSYWGELSKWYEEGDKRTCQIISKLQEIESLLKKLPASQRAKMQPMYTRLYTKADTLMDNMIDRVRIQCDKKPRRSKVHFHELATTSQPLS